MINYDKDLFTFGRHKEITIRVKNNATNGEVIKLLFPTAETQADEDECCMKVHFPNAFNIECFDLVWWNEPYKRGDAE